MNPNASTFNPNASSFSPADASTEEVVAAAGNAGVMDSFTEYAEMHENLEEEMEKDMASMPPAPAPTAGSSALPAHLAAHKREFWFPGARDCVCCHGYQYACKCVDGAGAPECNCISGGPVTPGPDPSLQAAAPPPQGGYGGGRGGRGGGRGSGRGRGGGRGGRGTVPCKFFFSQGGCRFGDSCSFSHQQQGY